MATYFGKRDATPAAGKQLRLASTNSQCSRHQPCPLPSNLDAVQQRIKCRAIRPGTTIKENIAQPTASLPCTFCRCRRRRAALCCRVRGPGDAPVHVPPGLAAVARHLLPLLRALQQQLCGGVVGQLLLAHPLKQRVRLQLVPLRQEGRRVGAGRWVQAATGWTEWASACDASSLQSTSARPAARLDWASVDRMPEQPLQCHLAGRVLYHRPQPRCHSASAHLPVAQVFHVCDCVQQASGAQQVSVPAGEGRPRHSDGSLVSTRFTPGQMQQSGSQRGTQPERPRLQVRAASCWARAIIAFPCSSVPSLCQQRALNDAPPVVGRLEVGVLQAGRMPSDS